MLGAAGIAYAPSTYFASVPFRWGKFPEITFGSLGKNIIDERNVNMAQQASSYLAENPDHKPVIVIGNQHVEGFLDELREKIPSLSVRNKSGGN